MGDSRAAEARLLGREQPEELPARQEGEDPGVKERLGHHHPTTRDLIDSVARLEFLEEEFDLPTQPVDLGDVDAVLPGRQRRVHACLGALCVALEHRVVDRQRQAEVRQQQLLQQMEAERTRQEQLSQELEATFETNDAEIIDLERALQERLGELKELFGVLQQAAGDARGNFETSVTQIQFPDRDEWLTEFAQKMGSTTRMPTLEEIERMWFELQREMTESARVARVTTNVVNASGEEEEREVVRVGLFNIVSNGKYLEYVPETGRVVELQRQPQSRFTSRAASTSLAGGMSPAGPTSM